MLEHTRRRQAPPPSPEQVTEAPPAFQWLGVRISEERERRRREAEIQERLPDALTDLHDALKLCVDSYCEAFGQGAAQISFPFSKIRVTIGESKQGGPGAPAAQQVEITIDAKLPGFTVRQAGKTMEIHVAILSGGKVSYQDGDRYLTMEELTRRLLDPVFFPKLPE
jgi:hypothetical protein